MRFAVFASMLCASVTSAAAADDLAPAAKAAGAIAMAELAPDLCSTLELDKDAVALTLSHNGLVQGDIGGQFREQTVMIAEIMMRDYRDHPEIMCEQMEKYLGEAGIGLLRKRTP